MITKALKKTRQKSGAVILILAYFLMLVVLPLVAVAYDMGQFYIYRQHLTNLVQVAALSCKPNKDSQFTTDCLSVMGAVVLFNRDLDKTKRIGGAIHQSKAQNQTGSVTVRNGMQTSIFQLKGSSSDVSRKRSNFVLTGTENIPLSYQPDLNSSQPIPLNMATKIFNVGLSGSSGTMRTDVIVLSGKYYPTFMPFLCSRQDNNSRGYIPINSTPVNVTAKYVKDH